LAATTFPPLGWNRTGEGAAYFVFADDGYRVPVVNSEFVDEPIDALLAAKARRSCLQHLRTTD
jgi:hypothetical protein